MNKIKKDDKIKDIIENHPKAIEIFLEFNLHCVGCPMVSQETLEDGCKAHGMDEKKINELVKKLNKKGGD